jgi:hypothetical protein
MKFDEYYQKQFLTEIKTLSFEKPSNVIVETPESFRVDSSTVFFGGKEWENCAHDLKFSRNKSYFSLCLFGMVCNDLNMHSNFKDQYPKFRSLTQYPKFGWTGYGCHFESPHWLLSKPLELGLVSYEGSTLADFVSFWKNDASVFFTQSMAEIDFDLYFDKLVNDQVFEKTEALLAIKKHFLESV